MIGVDVHDTVMPLPPPYPSPHFVTHILNGFNTSVSKSDNVLSMGFYPLNRGSDIGMGIPHVALNYLVPIHMLVSGSKSEFGVFSVLVNKSPVAVACLWQVSFNLNCQGPTMPLIPLPTGGVLAPSRNLVGFKLGDFFGSLFILLTDVFIQGMVNHIGNTAGKKLNNWLFKHIGASCVRQITPFFLRFPKGGYAMNKLIANTLTNLPSTIVLMFTLGSPVGYSPDYTLLGGEGDLADGQNIVGGKIAESLYDDPEVEEF